MTSAKQSFEETPTQSCDFDTAWFRTSEESFAVSFGPDVRLQLSTRPFKIWVSSWRVQNHTL